MVIAAIMLANVFNLPMAIMTGGDYIGGPGGCDLVELGLAMGPPLIREPGLEGAAAAAAAKIIISTGYGIDEVFLTHHSFNHKPKVIHDFIGPAFPSDITGILDRKFCPYLLVPIRADL